MAKKQSKKEVTTPVSKAKKPMSQNKAVEPKSASIVITPVATKESGRVKALCAFYDIESHTHRLVGEEWTTTPERAELLRSKNIAE